MSFSEALLVGANVRNRLRIATLTPPLHSTVHDYLHRIPGKAKEGGSGFDSAARLQDLDGKRPEEEGKAAMLPRPRSHDGLHLHPVGGAAAPRQPGNHFRRELHGVEVPPAPLLCMIGQAAGTATFRARNIRTDMSQADLDPPLLQPKVNRFDSPGFINSQQSGIMRRECVHPGTLCRR